MDLTFERSVRDAAFAYLRTAADDFGVVAWADLKRFSYRSQIVFLVRSGNGIFKPRQLEMPISILTAAPKRGRDAPYDDEVSDDGYLLYRYRGTDPAHHDNARLRNLMNAGLPLIHLHGIDKGRYLASAAVIVDDDPSGHVFLASLVELTAVDPGFGHSTLGDMQRSHQLRLTRQRIRQASFRERVLRAYTKGCALCRIAQPAPLDAAHIVPDAEGGASIVPNGLALCKIHHAAYDANLLGVRPDLVAEIQPMMLEQIDGPMLRHGLQELHGSRLWTPTSPATAPDRNALAYRYDQFREAS